MKFGTIFRPARPILPLAAPKYPAVPPRERPPWLTVGVRITVDVTGRVSAVDPSPLYFSTPHPRLAAFQAAVEAAVAQWRFFPAEEQHLEKATGPDGGSWWRVASTDKVATTADVAFTFNASGKILPDVPPTATTHR